MHAENKNCYFIYLIHNIKNNKVYVGKSISPQKRWKHHISTAFSKIDDNKCYIHRAIKKYGLDNFTFIILQELNNEEEYTLAEIYWIDFYKSNIYKYGNKFGYNMTSGGEGCLGRIVTQETRNKISAAQIGRIFSDEQRQNMSAARKNIILSEKHKQNMSKSRKGRFTGPGHHFFGKTRSKEYKLLFSGENSKVSKLKEKQVIEIRKKYKSGNYGVQELAYLYGVKRGQIGRIIHNKSWTHLLENNE